MIEAILFTIAYLFILLVVAVGTLTIYVYLECSIRYKTLNMNKWPKHEGKDKT